MTKTTNFFFTALLLAFLINTSSARWLPGSKINQNMNPCVKMASNRLLFIEFGENNNNSNGAIYKYTDSGINSSTFKMNSGFNFYPLVVNANGIETAVTKKMNLMK